MDLVSTAKTVRLRDNKPIITDEPFAETKEQLGGYYLVEANDINEALQLAARIPSARWGSIEVRPIVPMTCRYDDSSDWRMIDRRAQCSLPGYLDCISEIP